MAVMPGWGTFAGAIMDIIDKFIPNRRQRIRDKITALETELARALANNDAMRIADIMNQLETLRKKVSDEK